MQLCSCGLWTLGKNTCGRNLIQLGELWPSLLLGVICWAATWISACTPLQTLHLREGFCCKFGMLKFRGRLLDLPRDSAALIWYSEESGVGVRIAHRILGESRNSYGNCCFPGLPGVGHSHTFSQMNYFLVGASTFFKYMRNVDCVFLCCCTLACFSFFPYKRLSVVIG